VDEDREQTRAIHRLQREKQTLEGLLARQARPTLLKVHRDAQRLLKPLLVANPYARHLTFLDDRTRTRRDHVKYLTLIRAIALLHQYQRPIKTATRGGVSVPYIEVTLDDISIANKLSHQVLGRSLDELPPQTRRLLMALDRMVSEACAAQAVGRQDFRFSRRQVRERTGWCHTQVHVHLERLVELEYVLVHRGRHGQSFEYELLYHGEGQDGRPFLAGLLDVETLRVETTTESLRGLPPTLRGRFGPDSGGIRDAARQVSSLSQNDLPADGCDPRQNAHLDAAKMPSRRTSDETLGVRSEAWSEASSIRPTPNAQRPTL
jgi:hypothetical protein